MEPRSGRVRGRAGALAAAVLAAALPATAKATTFLRLYRDESKIVRVDGLKRVSVTNPAVATPVIISPAEIMLNGREVGRTSLYIWDQNGRTEIQVVVRPFTDELQKQLEEDIDDPDVKIQLISTGQGERVFLRGVLQSQGAYRNAIAVASAYVGAGNVVDLLEVRGVSEDPLAQLQRLINNPDIKIQIVTEPQSQDQQGNAPVIANIIMEGYVDDQRDMDRAIAIASSFVGGDAGRITNLMEVVNPLQVMVEGHLLELTRTEQSQIGVNWGTAETAVTLGGQSSAQVTQFSPNQVNFLENFLFPIGRGTLGGVVGPEAGSLEDLKRINPFFATLQFQLSTGQAKVLHNPKVVTRSGEQARIFVGGEAGSVVQGNFGNQQAEFRQFGLTMEVTPTVDHKGNINTDVRLELSNPDASLGASLDGATVPGFRRRETENRVTVKDGEHIIISGLINKDEQKIISKVPLLWKIPVLGRLFQNKRFQNSETELVVIVTPHLLASKRLRERFYQDSLTGLDKAIGNGLAADGRAGQLSEALKPAEENQDMVRQMFAQIRPEDGGAGQPERLTAGITVSDPVQVMAARPEAQVAPVTNPLTGQHSSSAAVAGETPSERIKRMLEARRRSGRGARTREQLARLQPSLPGASQLAQAPAAEAPPVAAPALPMGAPVGESALRSAGLELASAPGEVGADPMAPPELPGLVPVSGGISGRIHGLFDEVESDPAFRAMPVNPADGPATTGDVDLDRRVDELFNQIKTKLEGDAF